MGFLTSKGLVPFIGLLGFGEKGVVQGSLAAKFQRRYGQPWIFEALMAGAMGRKWALREINTGFLVMITMFIIIATSSIICVRGENATGTGKGMMTN